MRQLTINKGPALTMHIDLNSCFATIEKQANRLLRDRPVGVAAYDTPRGFVLAACYQAKARGIKLGVNVAEARAMCPGIIILTPDPAKYREAHKRLRRVLEVYTSDIEPKSIDEFVLNFASSPFIRDGFTMPQLASRVKKDIYQSLGEAVTVNIGIATNRFLAKYAAGFNKPNGLTVISPDKIKNFYEGMDLVDLPGINVRYKRRLMAAGIMTPLDFFAADERLLRRVVFKSVVGYYWYLRLRGWEVDTAKTMRRTIGHQYALSHKTTDLKELSHLLMKLCEKTGRRLRKSELYAGGIHLYIGFVRGGFGPIGFENMHELSSWHKGHRVSHRLYSTDDIFQAAHHLLKQAEIPAKVSIMSVNVFDLKPLSPEQLDLFGEDRRLDAGKRISSAMDLVNNRYGEFVVTPASMMDMQGTILDRIAFGQVRDL
jgi:DNA polymerase IV